MQEGPGLAPTEIMGGSGLLDLVDGAVGDWLA